LARNSTHTKSERERSKEGGDKVQQERRIMPPAVAGSLAVKANTSAFTRVSAVSPALKKFLGVTLLLLLPELLQGLITT
jgi:hypothetical protein